LDINGENIRVGFEDQIWSNREVPAFSVRLVAQEGSSDDFDPQVDEVVEVSVAASEANPSGWSLGKVKTIKNSFYFIGFVGTQKGSQDLIVERNALRRVNSETPIDPTSLERRLIPVDPDLHTWVRSQDAPGCLTHVQSKARLLLCGCTHLNETAKAPEVLLIGDQRAVVLGEKLLLHIHFKNQMEMQRFHEQREQLMGRLQEQQKWYQERNQESFSVEQSLVGKIIGKKGDNIKQIRDRYGVEINLSQPSNSGRPTTITVTGSTAEDCLKARNEMEFVTAKIPIETDAVGWILGRGYQNIQDISKKAELHYARFDDKTACLELCGLKHQVDDAKMLISIHQEYRTVYQDMDEEQNLIQQSFEELEGAKGKGEGRREKGKGKSEGDKGKGKSEGEKGKGKSGGRGKDGKGDKNGDKGGKGYAHAADDEDDAWEDEDYPPERKGKGRGRGNNEKGGRGKGGRKGGGK